MRQSRRLDPRGFTLVELLVVIGIIALLIGILLPSLSKARESANALKCSANLRSVGQGLALYLASNKGGFPLAYTYQVGTFNAVSAPDVGGGTAAEPVFGYVHWSSYIYGVGRTGGEAFVCPSFGNDGGHPATNPEVRIPGQNFDPAFNVGARQWDQQAPRIAYTVNEVIMGRNKTNAAVERAPTFPGAFNVYVKAGEIRRPSQTILATEMARDLRFFEDGAFAGDPDSSGGGNGVYKTHRPVNALAIGVANNYVESRPGVSVPVFVAQPPPANVSFSQTPTSLLWWVGRNHGKGATARANFLYVDGHVETKTLEDTLGRSKSGQINASGYEWGDKIWSIKAKPSIVLQ